jgi:hypothetical protein
LADGGTIDFASIDPGIGSDTAASAADFSAFGASFDTAFTPFLELFSAF